MSKKQTEGSFWAKVKVKDVDKCWDWSGACNSTGYGNVTWHGKVYTAHRVAAWLSGLVKEPSAPKNKQAKGYVLHKCDNRKCCNPNHLFIGNYTDNQKDAYTKNRRVQPRGEKHTNAKLTQKEVGHIRKMYKNKWFTQTELAKEYGVSQRVISLVVRKESYK